MLKGRDKETPLHVGAWAGENESVLLLPGNGAGPDPKQDTAFVAQNSRMGEATGAFRRALR